MDLFKVWEFFAPSGSSPGWISVLRCPSSSLDHVDLLELWEYQTVCNEADQRLAEGKPTVSDRGVTQPPELNLIQGGRKASAGGGDGPQDPGVDIRVKALESGLTELKLALVRIEVTLNSLSTKVDSVRIESALSLLDAKMVAIDARIGRVEASIAVALTTAIGKAIGPIQFLGILSGAATIVAGLVAFFGWATHQFWFPH